MGDDGVPVRRIDFEGAIRQINGYVPLEVGSEILLLLIRLEAIVKLSQTVGGKQLLFGKSRILVDNDMSLDYFGDFLFSDASRRVVRGSVLRYCRPVVSLWKDNF